jgi:hypothetical protein
MTQAQMNEMRADPKLRTMIGVAIRSFSGLPHLFPCAMMTRDVVAIISVIMVLKAHASIFGVLCLILLTDTSSQVSLMMTWNGGSQFREFSLILPSLL